MKYKKWLATLLSLVCMFQMNLHYGGPLHTVHAEDYWPTGPEVQGEAAVVMDASTGTVLFEKNIDDPFYPASITKILTALLAVENCSLEEEVTFSYDAVHKIDGTHISRDEGEIMTMEQCLYAVLLGSANDCAYAVAEHVGTNYDNFINMMNDKAKELGCTNSHFNNPHGLPDEEHYTSAHDMALISRAALKNDTFRMISETEKYTIPKTNKHTEEETPIVNHHKMLTAYKGDRAHLYEYCIGGKTGYTQVSGATLVTYAEKDGMTLICVVMKETGTNHYLDTRALLDYCFENFALWNVAENETELVVKGTADQEIFGNDSNFVELDTTGQIVLPKAASFSDAVSQVNMEQSSKDVIASLEYSYAGKVVGSVDIKASNTKVTKFQFQKLMTEIETEKKTFSLVKILPYIGIFVIGILLMIGIYLLVNNFHLIRYRIISKRKRRREYKIIKPAKQSRRRKKRKW